MKVNTKIIILVIICIAVLTGAFIVDRVLNKSYLKELKFDELIEKIDNDETFMFLISQTQCAHCISFKPKLSDIAKEYKLDIYYIKVLVVDDNKLNLKVATKILKEYKLDIYYIDVDLLTDEEKSTLKSYVNFDSTPVTVFIKSGEETSAATRIVGDAKKDRIIMKLKSNGFIE